MQTEISGDGYMRPSARLKYLAVNALRNLRGIVVRGGAERPHIVSDVVCKGQSPSRLLLESFIAAELPRLLPQKEISVIEIGCGSGSMMHRLSSLGYHGRYVGIDVQNRFAAVSSDAFDVTFRQMDAHEFAPDDPVDLIVSVSALEHIPDDRRLVDRLPQWVKPNAVELHAVPAGASLLAYLWHGYRQYTVACLRQRFGTRARIVPLGGFGTLLVHVAFITVPEIILGRSARKRFPRFYARTMYAGCLVDRILPFGATAHVVIRQH